MALPGPNFIAAGRVSIFCFNGLFDWNRMRYGPVTRITGNTGKSFHEVFFSKLFYVVEVTEL